MIDSNIRREDRTPRSKPLYNNNRFSFYKNPLYKQEKKVQNRKFSKQEISTHNPITIRQNVKSKSGDHQVTEKKELKATENKELKATANKEVKAAQPKHRSLYKSKPSRDAESKEFEKLNSGMNELDFLEELPPKTPEPPRAPDPFERIIKDLLTHLWKSLSVPK